MRLGQHRARPRGLVAGRMMPWIGAHDGEEKRCRAIALSALGLALPRGRDKRGTGDKPAACCVIPREWLARPATVEGRRRVSGRWQRSSCSESGCPWAISRPESQAPPQGPYGMLVAAAVVVVQERPIFQVVLEADMQPARLGGQNRPGPPGCVESVPGPPCLRCSALPLSSHIPSTHPCRGTRQPQTIVLYPRA